ncbi:MAG: ABC transporter substrate-binding protein [Thaumarchaeota archaeon]|nr:ABC transporter substrate-binding protein [Nitrososphaerota archaeon]
MKSKRSALTKLEVVLIVIVIVIAGVAAYLAVTPAPTATPGKLNYTDLIVQPSKVESGKPVTVIAELANVGGSNVTETVYLYVNGTAEASKSVTVPPGESLNVTFTITKSAGTYVLSVGPLSKVLTVLPAIKNPDTIIVATIGEPETLDPAWAYDTASGEVIFNVYETLIAFHDGKTDEFDPLLATDWYVSPDGLTYAFKIRTGVKFSNGNPLTPEDVEYSFERAMVQDRDGGPVWMFLEPLLGIDSTREYNLTDPTIAAKVGHMIDDAVESNSTHVVFHLKRPYPPFMAILAQTWSSILDKEWCIEQGDWPGWKDYVQWVKYNNPETPPLQEKMMGTGPFKLDRWEHGVEVVLTRNDNYWREPAKIKTAIIKKVDEWSTRKLMFLSGDADIVYVPRAHIKELEGVPNIRVYKDLPTLMVSPAMFFTFDISSDSPYIGSGKLDGNGIPPNFFSDVNVRKAFAYSFDYDRFIEEALLGEAIRPANPIAKGLPFYWEDAPKYEYNLTLAEEYFKKAWGGEVWEKGFSLTITYNVGNLARKTACEILKYNIESLNPKFKIYIRAVEWPTFLRDMVKSRLPIFLIGWLADYPDPHNFVHPFMHSKGTFAAWQHYSNPEVDELIEEGISTVNATKRAEIYHKLALLYYEDVPSVPLAQPVDRHYERDWVKGWYYNPIYPGVYFYPLSKGY